MPSPTIEKDEHRAPAARRGLAASDIGVVVIGRNEGERLARCLATVHGRGSAVVYVDSASRDGSPETARAAGVEVLELDPARPMSAARARNEGFERLADVAPEIRFVQFVDGDCEIAPGWLEAATAAMEARPDVDVVCGRLRELHPDASPYNRLADMEWDGPTGEVGASGGIFLARTEAFRRAGGFDATVLAAEDDEFCLRVRRSGGKILRLPELMAWHDMAMTHFSAWWRRTVRAGQAYAQGYALHGRGPERHFAVQTRGILIWGAALPAAAVLPAWPTYGLSLLLLPMGWGALYAKVKQHGLSRGWSTADARLYAGSIVLAKIPLALGMLRYAAARLSRREARLIEHKGPAT